MVSNQILNVLLRMQKIEATVKTPEVILDSDLGSVSLKGISISENPRAFYTPVFEMIEQYLKQPQPATTLHVDLEYFNSSSAIMIRDLIRLFENHQTGPNCVVKWYHDNDDHSIRNSGMEFKNIFTHVQFELIGLDR